MGRKKKLKDCLSCKLFDGKDCHKNGNVALLVKYRKESKIYLHTPQELNKNKDCESYVQYSSK